MDEFKQTDLLLLQSSELSERTPFCPEDRVVASYFDGQLAKNKRKPLERHLADCRFCQARIGMLNRLDLDETEASVPGDALAQAKLLHRNTRRRSVTRVAAWASAAVVVLSMFLLMGGDLFHRDLTGAGPSIEAPVTEQFRQLRNVDRHTARLDILIDSPSGAAGPGTQVHWQHVDGNIHYTIRVLSEAGDIVWTERSQENQWVLQESLQLAAGREYYLQIEAVMPDGDTVSSRHVSFQTANPR